jgi:phage shock protein A
MYRSEVTEGWIRDCQVRSRTLADEVRRRKQAEKEVERLKEELEQWRERALAAEAGVRRVA